jgi:Fe-S cluster assembly protein SufD
MSAIALQQDLLEAAVTALPPDELSAVREAAVDRFIAIGFPTTKHEDWKYTNLSDAAELSNTWLQSKAESRAQPVTVDTRITEQVDAHWITIANGMVDPASLRELDALKHRGITVTRLADGVDEGSITDDDPMSAFNAALLLIDDGSVAVSQVRILVEIGARATLRVIECALSAGTDRQFANSVTQAVLGDEAELSFVRLQQRQKNHLSVNRFSAKLERDAVLNYNNFDLGGELARNDIVADIVAAGASVNLRGLYLAAGDQHIDNHTRVDHRVGPATSSEEYRGILNGRARCVFNGKAIVHEGADGTDADQSNHNLLLSDKAEIDTKPELEIYADDVKCSHGATVGQLDKTALFYLRSRGLDKDEATQVLTRAFASAILGKLAIGECHEYLAAAMDKQLDDLIDEK